MVPHVIICGGSFGGLSAARRLRAAAVRVTLIDKAEGSSLNSRARRIAILCRFSGVEK